MGWALENYGSGECKTIAEGLFKVEREYGAGKLHGYCPVHGDKSSASFVYSYEGDWCKCQSCGFGGDLVKLWAEVTGHDHQDIKAFKAEFGEGAGTYTPKKRRTGQTSKPKTAEEPPPEVFVDEEHLDALPPIPDARIKELIDTRGWTPAAIAEMDLRQFVAGGRHKKIAIPVRDDQGRLCNIRLYQPGAKVAKCISWYDPVCQKCGGQWHKPEKQKLCSQCGALPTDYGYTRLLPAPSQWKAGQIWLVEGESDLLCALSKGVNATTQTAGAGTWRERFSPSFAGRDVIIAYDADGTGHKGAMQAAKSIAEHAKSVRVLVWPKWMGGADK